MSLNPLNWLFGVDAEIKRGQELDARIDEFNRQRVAEGTMTLEQYEDYVDSNSWAYDYQGQVNDGFYEGASQAWDRITDPAERMVEGAASAAKTILLLQFTLAALALYLVYKYFSKGGTVKSVMG